MVEFKDNSEELTRKLNDAVANELKDNAAVLELLTNAKARYKEVDVLGTMIKIKPIVPKAVRHFMDKIKDDKEYNTLGKVEETTYRLLATMCIEEPWNKTETWSIVDDGTGVALDFLTKVYEAAQDSTKAIKTFRTK